MVYNICFIVTFAPIITSSTLIVLSRQAPNSNSKETSSHFDPSLLPILKSFKYKKGLQVKRLQSTGSPKTNPDTVLKKISVLEKLKQEVWMP